LNPSEILAAAQAARERISPKLEATPLLRSHALSERLKRPVYIKLESLNPTGAFKVRPALNAVLADFEQARAKGVVTSSSGNFAQAVAWAAREFGLSAQIVMMRSASEYKRRRTEELGAEVVLCDDSYASRWETTHRIEQETGRLLLHPYDAVNTIAGDGTIGLELLEQLTGDFTVLCPVSGGGLISGIASAVKTQRPGCRVYGVQPEQNPSMHRSLQVGEPTEIVPGRSMADALTVAKPGTLTFQLVQATVEDMLLVSEESIARAVKYLWETEKLVGEPGGAVGVAACLDGPPSGKGPLVLILSGGNLSAKSSGEMALAD
jgi:threonine dehydratase